MTALRDPYDSDEGPEPAGDAPRGPVLTLVREVDYSTLSRSQRLDLLVELEHARARIDAQQQRLLAAISVDPQFEPVEDREHNYVREEVACALRLAARTAGDRMAIARELVGRLPATLRALDTGAISFLHARTLAEATLQLSDDDVVTRIEADVLPRARHQTRAEFARSVRRAVARHNSAAAEDQHDTEYEQRHVRITPADHGMAEFHAYLPAEDAMQIGVALDAAASHKADGDCRTTDQRRADALVRLTTHNLTNPTDDDDETCPCGHPLPTWQGRRPSVHVTVALSTLLGLDNQPGELDRYGPIPATVARRIAADPTGTWRRLLTDERGQLIDYGRTTYRPPADLREYVIARDQTCRFPGCQRSARRCDIDHIQDFAAGGPTNAANTHPLCERNHNCKHDAGWTAQRSPDGDTRWTSPSGRNYLKPAPELPTDTTARPDEPDDPPPF